MGLHPLAVLPVQLQTSRRDRGQRDEWRLDERSGTAMPDRVADEAVTRSSWRAVWFVRDCSRLTLTKRRVFPQKN